MSSSSSSGLPTPAKLGGSNARSWLSQLQSHLVLRGLWGEVNPARAGVKIEKTTSAAEGPAELSEAEERARAFLLVHMEEYYVLRYERMAAFPTARSIWQDVQSRVNNNTLAHIRHALHLFNALKKQPAESIDAYIVRAENLAADLSGTSEARSEAQICNAIMAGLDASYKVVLKTITFGCKDGVIALDELRRNLLVEESDRDGPEGTSKQASQAYMAAGSFIKSGFGGKHGRSSQQKGRSGLQQKKPGSCHYCGKTGHFIADCRARKADEGAQPEPKGKKVQKVVNVAFNAIGDSMADPRPKGGQRWFVDSGATTHLTNDRKVLENYTPFPSDEEHTLRWGDGKNSPAVGAGTLHIRDSNGRVMMTLQNVWFVPQAKGSLMSVSQAAEESGAEFVFDSDSCTITQGGKTALSAPLQQNKLYGFYNRRNSWRHRVQVALAAKRAEKQAEAAAVATKHSPADPELWHRRLGHVSYSTLSKLQAGSLVTGITAAAAAFKEEPVSCESCVMGKHTKMPFTSSEHESSKPLELLHTDLCQQPTDSLAGSRYILTVLDDYSKYSAFIPLKHKSDVRIEMPKLIARWENQLGSRVKTLRSDNGREYLSEELGEYLVSKGIKHESSVPYTPEQNGAAERLNRSLLEITRTLLNESGQPPELWAEACNTANYMRNRTTITDKGKTPLELFHGQVPDLSAARVFGSTAYVRTDDARRSKLDPTSQRGVMVGYSPSRKAYRILVDGMVIEARDVIFDETLQPRGTPVVDEDLLDLLAAPRAASPADTADMSGSAQGAEQQQTDAPLAPEQQPTTAPAAPVQQPAPVQPGLRRSVRFSGQQATTDQAAEPAERSERTQYSLRNRPKTRVQDSFLAVTQQQAWAATEDPEDPGSYEEAIAGPDAEQWEAAMEDELQSLTDHNTGVLVDKLPAGAKAITLKWVFTRKRDAAGKVERYKARLVARGFQQRAGLDYDELFAPVGKHTTLRLLLSLVAAEDMELHQLDFKTAFLNGDLAEEIYVEQPPGYRLGRPGQVIRLSKALYGLKQAPRAWHQTLKKELLASGFVESDADPGLFFLDTSTGTVYVLIYVDDALIAAHTLEAVLQAKRVLMEMFAARDLGEAGLFLGMAIERNRQQHTIKLHQERAVKDLLAKYNMQQVNARTVPLSPGNKLQKDQGEPLDAEQQRSYSSLVGSLNYLAVCTRPDISFPVGVLARYLASSTADHMAAAKGVLRYLAGTANHGLNYGAQLGDSSIIGYCDADHAGDLDQRRSTTGFTFILNGGAVSWSSKRQETVALSTVEAEYMAAAAAAKEAVWLRTLLAELGQPCQIIQLYADNQGAIQLTKNPVVSARSKHIDVRYHFVRERVAMEQVAFTYISTGEMVADSLTKGLPGDKHSFCKLSMGVY